MAIFKQSTAYIHQFTMILTSDHLSGATGKTVTVKLGKNGATGAAAAGTVAEVDSTNLPGTYSVSLTNVDTNTAGSLKLVATASGCDQTDETHQIWTTIPSDISITGSGRVFVNSGVTKNTAQTIMFPMTVGGVPTPGLTVTGQRNFGSGWSNISGTITDLTLGVYSCALTQADTNANAAIYRFTATGADDRDVALQFDP